jgi:AI-2 transport protein TqsA
VTEPAAVTQPERRTNPLFVAAAVVITVAGLQAFGGLLGPLFLALVLVVGVSPLAEWLRRRGLPRWTAFLVTLVGTYAILFALVGALAWAVAQLTLVLPSYSGQLNALLQSASDLFVRFGGGPLQIQDVLGQFDVASLLGFVQGLVGQAAGLLTNFVLVLSVLLFMAIDSAGWPDRLRLIGRQRPHVVDAFTAFAGGTRRFLVVSTVFGLTIAVLDTIVLLVLGVPLALMFGLLSFVANFVPNIGFLIALAPPALFALLVGGPGLMIAVVVPFLIINIVLQTIVQPRFVGDAVGLSVTVTFLALVFWGWVVGPLGALLAIPLTLMVKALLVDLNPQTRWINALIGSGPASSKES